MEENTDIDIILADDVKYQMQLYDNKQKPSKFSYMMKAFYYFITFQKTKLKNLEDSFESHMSDDSISEEIDVEKEKEKKRIIKLSDSTKRIVELNRLCNVCNNTIYESKIKEVLGITIAVHEKYKNDIELNIYKLEQFHSYQTDRFIELIVKATLEIVDIKIPIPVKVGSSDYIEFEEILEEEKITKKEVDIYTTDLFDLVDSNVFAKAQQLLLSMNDSWKIKLPTFTSVSDFNKMVETYTKIPEVKRVLKSSAKDYILIGTISDPYVVLLHKNGTEIIQINIMTNFPRVIKLNNN